MFCWYPNIFFKPSPIYFSDRSILHRYILINHLFPCEAKISLALISSMFQHSLKIPVFKEGLNKIAIGHIYIRSIIYACKWIKSSPLWLKLCYSIHEKRRHTTMLNIYKQHQWRHCKKNKINQHQNTKRYAKAWCSVKTYFLLTLTFLSAGTTLAPQGERHLYSLFTQKIPPRLQIPQTMLTKQALQGKEKVKQTYLL